MTFREVVSFINKHAGGWITYYGRFYKSVLYAAFRGLNEFLVRWAMRKYKTLKRRKKQACAWLASIAKRYPRLFAHWRLGVVPT
jgi:RNA-directed DNA polymerase